MGGAFECTKRALIGFGPEELEREGKTRIVSCRGRCGSGVPFLQRGEPLVSAGAPSGFCFSESGHLGGDPNSVRAVSRELALFVWRRPGLAAVLSVRRRRLVPGLSPGHCWK
jgi:hypothetical protein